MCSCTMDNIEYKPGNLLRFLGLYYVVISKRAGGFWVVHVDCRRRVLNSNSQPVPLLNALLFDATRIA